MADKEQAVEQTDLAPYIRTIRESVRAMVDDDQVYELIEAAAAESRAVWDRHDEQLKAIAARVEERATVYGEAFDQVMRLADDL